MKLRWRKLCTRKSLANCGTLSVLLVVAFVLFQDPFLILWWHEQPLQRSKHVVFPLDLAANSVDDMYSGCRNEMATVIHQFGVLEWHVNRNFSIAWAYIEKQAKPPVHGRFSHDHSKAIHLYTHKKVKKIREDFDKGVKTRKHGYGTRGFLFHYLYFYLMDAIWILRENQTLCRTVFHSTGGHFSQSVVHKEVRLGAFTLTASSKDLFKSPGVVSCFEIYTCFGADVAYYSAVDREGQVLIPPHEVFKVTNVLTDIQRCAVLYQLESTKVPRSDLNCKLVRRKLMPYFEAFSGDWKINFGIMVACMTLLVVSSVVLIKHKEERFVCVVLGALLILMGVVAMWALLTYIPAKPFPNIGTETNLVN